MERPRASSPYIRRTSRTQQKERQKTAHTAVPIVKRVDAEKVLDEVDSVGCNYFSISCSKSFMALVEFISRPAPLSLVKLSISA